MMLLQRRWALEMTFCLLHSVWALLLYLPYADAPRKHEQAQPERWAVVIFNYAQSFVMSKSPPELRQRRYGKSCVKVLFVLLVLSDELMHCNPGHCILSLLFTIFERRAAWLNSWGFYISTIGSLLSLETGAEEAFLHLQVVKKFCPFLPLGCSEPHKGLMSWALGKAACGCTSDCVIIILPKPAVLLWAEAFTESGLELVVTEAVWSGLWNELLKQFWTKFITCRVHCEALVLSNFFTLSGVYMTFLYLANKCPNFSQNLLLPERREAHKITVTPN